MMKRRRSDLHSLIDCCRVRLQELIKLRNLEQKHERMKSLLLDIDFRSVVHHHFCEAALIY